MNQAEPAGSLSKKPILVALIIATVVGMIGGLATEIGPWYRGLIKPAWQPPDWAFGPVWTLIYIFTGIAGVRAWRRGEPRQQKFFFAALIFNCVLNIVWSVLFFNMQRPDYALAEVVALWLSVLLLVILPWRYAKSASLLMLPYLTWVAIAAYLNWTIVQLNGML